MITQGVYEDHGRLWTRYMGKEAPMPYYGEDILDVRGAYYRSWDPFHSKLAAALKSGMRHLPITPESHVLYLGAATGTTVSHISDIAAEGRIYAVEVSPRPMRDLILLATTRSNIIPILGNARRPWEYIAYALPKGCDVAYQDIAQRDQLDIFLKNLEMYLKPGGWGMLALKTHSIDSSMRPKDVLSKVKKALLPTQYIILKTYDISRYQKGHYMLIVRAKNIKDKSA